MVPVVVKVQLLKVYIKAYLQIIPSMQMQNYHIGKAYPECPYIVQSIREVDFFTKQLWRPSDEPYLLAFPCHHIFQNSKVGLRTLTLTWTCPICLRMIDKVTEYPSTQIMIDALDNNRHIFTYTHYRQQPLVPISQPPINGYYTSTTDDNHPGFVPNHAPRVFSRKVKVLGPAPFHP